MMGRARRGVVLAIVAGLIAWGVLGNDVRSVAQDDSTPQSPSAARADGATAAEASAKPKFTVLEHPSPEQLQAGFARWARQYPHAFRVQTRGTTPGRRPILMGRITDDRVADDDKQIVLLTSCHVGKELNAGTGLLRLMKWLLSDDPEAAEVRRKQIVLVVPYTDPDAIASGRLERLREIYGSIWTSDGVTEPDKHPEAAVLQAIMDEFRPELYIDFHGLNFAEQTMWESTGISWASAVSRCYLHDVPRLIDEAAEAQGFLITKGEQDAGQILTTGDIPNGRPQYFYFRRPTTNITIYPYSRFHSLAFIMEVGFEESLIARTRRALQIGHQRWRGERYAGYPVNQVGLWTAVAVAAWGTNAEQRRQSRCELWQKLPQLGYGVAGPIPRDSVMAYVATTPAGRDQVRYRKLTDVLATVRAQKRFDAKALADAIRRSPATGFGGGKYDPTVVVEHPEPIRHGLTIRLLIPYLDAEVREIRLDGHLLAESATDGYQVRHQPGTLVEIAIPPDKVDEFHIASCRYESPTRRQAGFRSEDW